jgi:hypothetical protein
VQRRGVEQVDTASIRARRLDDGTGERSHVSALAVEAGRSITGAM